MQGDLSIVVSQLLGRMPQWLRSELSSDDGILKARAEDTLSAMIVAALAGRDTAAEPLPSADSSVIAGLTANAPEI